MYPTGATLLSKNLSDIILYIVTVKLQKIWVGLILKVNFIDKILRNDNWAYTKNEDRTF